MFERTKIAERLWAQAVMCEERHTYTRDEKSLPNLSASAQECREVAFVVLRDVLQSVAPTLTATMLDILFWLHQRWRELIAYGGRKNFPSKIRAVA